MRLVNPVSAFNLHPRVSLGRMRSVAMPSPSRLPTVYPTRSSYLQRLLWWLRIGR